MSPPTTINTLITSLPGLPNLTLPLPSTTTLQNVYKTLLSRLPPLVHNQRLLLSTTSSIPLSTSSNSPLSSLTTNDFITLRLSLPLCGGKGGFGSQLRAAGGRMSSRKKRGQAENNDSCRNLDGRRMRTVKEAKALAAYLEIKPEMEKKEKEKRRERWSKIVEDAERRADGGGGGGGGKRFEDVKWLEETEEERERTREAVLRVMKEGGWKDRNFMSKVEGSSGSDSDGDGEQEEEEEDVGEGSSSSSKKNSPVGSASKVKAAPTAGPRFAGFDEDDDFMSSDDEKMEDIAEEEEEEEEDVDKGKGKASA